MDPYAVPSGPYQPQSGYPEYGAHQQFGPQTYSLRGLSTALTVLFIAVAAMMTGSAGSLYYRATLFDDLSVGIAIDADTADGADALVAVFGGLQGALVLAIAVVFIIWQYRHAVNARGLGSRRSLGPGWAIGGWFIPFANLLLPAMQVFGASRYSDLARGRGRPDGGQGAGIVVAWAIAFGAYAVISGIAGVAAQDTGPTDEVLSSAADADRTLGTGYLIGVAAAVLAIVMVRSLSQRQAQALQAYASGMGAAQGPWGVPHDPWGTTAQAAQWGGQPPAGGVWGAQPQQPHYPQATQYPQQPQSQVQPPLAPDSDDERPSGPPAPPAPPPPPA